VGNVLHQHRAYIENLGQPVDQLVNKLLTASRNLDTNPKAMIQQLAEAYKVDLLDLVSAEPAEQNKEVSALQTRIHELETRLANREQSEKDAQTRHLQERQTKITGDVDSFIADKPDIDLIANEFEANIRAIRAEQPDLDNKSVLTEAYERAMWSNPTTRQKLIEKQEAEREQARIAKAKEAAAKANAASSINVSSQSQANQPRDYRQDMRAIWRKNNAA
jgi:uncharacterized coiled-coil protein SlyX